MEMQGVLPAAANLCQGEQESGPVLCPAALGQEVVMTSKELLCSFMGIINVQCNLVYPKGSDDT